MSKANSGIPRIFLFQQLGAHLFFLSSMPVMWCVWVKAPLAANYSEIWKMHYFLLAMGLSGVVCVFLLPILSYVWAILRLEAVRGYMDAMVEWLLVAWAGMVFLAFTMQKSLGDQPHLELVLQWCGLLYLTGLLLFLGMRFLKRKQSASVYYMIFSFLFTLSVMGIGVRAREVLFPGWMMWENSITRWALFFVSFAFVSLSLAVITLRVNHIHLVQLVKTESE